MTALLRADWMRLRRRRDLWLVALLLAALTAASYGLGLSSAIASLAQLPPDAQVDAADRVGPFAYPQSIVAALQNGQLLLLAVMAYFASGTVAAEFVYGTLRTSLLARHDRIGFVVARVVVLGSIGLAGCLILAAMGAILPAVAAVAGARLPEVEPMTAGGVLGILGAAWLVVLAVVAVATLAAVAARSAAVGLLAVAVTYGVEAGIANVATALGQPLQAMAGLLPLTSALRVVGAATAAATDTPLVAPFGDPSVPVAAAALAAVVWIAGLVALAAILLERSDIA